VVHNLLPLSLRGVERRSNRFLTVGVVAHDVEELAGRASERTLMSPRGGE
jgi:hypothetical protein